MRSLCMCGNLGMLIFLYILIWLFIVSFSLIHIFNCSVSFQAYGSHNFFSYPKTLLLWFLISSLLWTNRLKFLVRVREREGKMIVNQPLKPLPMGRKPKRGICMCVCVCVCATQMGCVCVWLSHFAVQQIPTPHCKTVQFSRSVVSDSSRAHGLQHTRLPVHHHLPELAQTRPSSQWCQPTVSSSVIPFSSGIQSFPASGSFPMSQFFTSGSQRIGISASSPSQKQCAGVLVTGN